MEVLRETLKILFHQQSPRLILLKLKDKPLKMVDAEVDASLFRKLYVTDSPSQLTLDQAGSIMNHLTDVWMKKADDKHAVFAERVTVFNVLLHFTMQVLTIKDSNPICHYEHLLRWNDLSSLLSEDLLTTSFLASKDLYNNAKRSNFNWPTVIGHDNRALNEMFKDSMTDLHFHLNGSSLNFELNWLSLMNKTGGWSKQFMKFHENQHEVISTSDDDVRESFYLCVMKASALRLLLFEFALGGCDFSSVTEHDLNNLERILSSKTAVEALTYISAVDASTQDLRHILGKRYKSQDGSCRIPDYATMDRITQATTSDKKNYMFSVLSGERWLTYTLFRYIYGTNNHVDQRVVAWFYAYLLYRTQFRTELVQRNEALGFANFAIYEERKSSFIRKGSVYDLLLSQMAACGFLFGGENRILEARITPKPTLAILKRHLSVTEKQIRDDHFLSKTYVPDVDNGLSYILHFIKKEDKGKHKDASKGKCRHDRLRYDVKKQAHAIWNMRVCISDDRKKIVGIDAANSEINARPEVFAQAFRFLRDNDHDYSDFDFPKDLGMTYHVGEDYLDVVDGLRAVDEVLHYMCFRNGDRFGHGLVLGVDVKAYYRRLHNFILLPCQVLLDNVVWLYNTGKSMPSFIAACRDLEILYETYLRKVYSDKCPTCTMWDYYQSWLLRGDNPWLYYTEKDGLLNTRVTSKWSKYNYNDMPDAIEARNNKTARDLYRLYHYDADVRRLGSQTVQVHLSDDIISLISEVQESMLETIERANICIECNPTSNLRIGHIKGYSTHPIVRMFNYNLDIGEIPHSISVSINTDDKGIFATSLEREYSLLALSLEKEYVKTKQCTPRQIYDWLDKIRRLGFEQRFCAYDKE